MGHRVLALEAHDGVWTEDRRGVLSLDSALVEIVHARRSEGDGAVLRRAHHQQPRPRVRGQPGDQARMELFELLHRQAVVP